MKLSMLKCLTGGILAMGFLAGAVLGQGLTSSTISGIVTDSARKPVAGATVTIFYTPTNTTATTTTNSAGRYTVSGLQVGGPYTVTASSGGLKTKERTDVY